MRLSRLAAWCFWPALALVLWGELTPQPPSLPGIFVDQIDISDKIEHFTSYLTLSGLATLAWARRPRSHIGIFLGLAALGFVLEILQGYVGRDRDMMDEVANILGITVGMALARPFRGALRLVGVPVRD